MTEVLCALVLLAAGFWAGRKSASRQPKLPEPGEQALREMQEDRKALAQLMSYSAERAYGTEET